MAKYYLLVECASLSMQLMGFWMLEFIHCQYMTHIFFLNSMLQLGTSQIIIACYWSYNNYIVILQYTLMI